jgi:hypothetical protein
MKSIVTPMRDPLEDAFFAAVDPGLVGLGWRSSVELPYEIVPIEGRYFRPSAGLVVPAIHLSYQGREQRHPYIEVTVGVTCPSAERLLCSVGQLCNVMVEAAPGIESGPWELPLKRDRDVRPAVAEAIALVQQHWRPVADSLPDVDALIAALRSLGDGEQTDGVQVPAILAAAGRRDDARAELSNFRRLYRDTDYDGWADAFETRLDVGIVVPPPSADAFPAPRPLTKWEGHYSWGEAAAMAAGLTYALARHLRRKPKPDTPA